MNSSHKRYCPVNSLKLIRGLDSKSFLGWAAGHGGLWDHYLLFCCVCQRLKVKTDSLESGPVCSSGVNIDIFSRALAARLITVLLGLQRREYLLVCMLTTHVAPVMMTSSAASALSLLSVLHAKNATGSELRWNTASHLQVHGPSWTLITSHLSICC